MAAHYAFKTEFCNISAGHEKGLVEGLVGWIRRNIFVPIPRVETIDELNAEILRRCLKYREHKITGREHTVGIMAQSASAMMAPLSKFKYDPSKSIIAGVDYFSTAKFDYNNYSVPVKYADKEVTIKGYGNEIVIMYRNSEIARYVDFGEERLMTAIKCVQLLLIDELPYLTFNRYQSEMLFQVISERSERASIILTTNLQFSSWTDLFENEMMVAALIDRITFRSHILNMNVKDSYRLEQTLLNGKEVKHHE